jgi:subtilase family serine protease
MNSKNLLGAGMMLALALAAQSALAAPVVADVAAAAVEKAAAPGDTVEFTVYLPLRHQQELDALIAELHDKNSPKYQQWLQPAEFLQQFGPSAADLQTVRDSLTARGFTVVKANAHGVTARGPASGVANTFAVTVHSRTINGHTRFIARSALHIPGELAALNPRVLGLESVPERQMHAHQAGPGNRGSVNNRYSAEGPYWFDDLKQAYSYPAYGWGTNGNGVNVAILMSDLLFPGDIAAAFNHENFTAITGQPVPSVTTVLVDGGGAINGPGSFEATLDVQQVLGGAPQSNVTLVSLPELADANILDGYAYIIDTNTFDIVNSSFGECELEYLPQDNDGVDYSYILQQYHELFVQGNAQGITFVAASGDSGALLCPSADYGNPGASPVFQPGVSTPADDPDVTAVGGGNLITTYVSGSLDSAYVRESAYADPEVPYDPYGLGQNVSGGVWGGGGGISSVFSKPAYQWLANTGSWRWRTLPDVGMQVGGCPLGLSLPADCGADDSAVVIAYGVNYGGGFYGVIGTSVSSPEFVGSLALFEQQLGRHHRVGNVNYFLYAQGALQTLAGGVHAPGPLQFYHRNIPGFDGLYNGGFPSYNYDYIYGNGSPDVRKLFGLQFFYPAAGLPQTPSNP